MEINSPRRQIPAECQPVRVLELPRMVLTLTRIVGMGYYISSGLRVEWNVYIAHLECVIVKNRAVMRVAILTNESSLF